jgi:hypothetical protein
MVNRDLLKEAIADAKAVKETAIANAKAALEEAFTPYLKEKLAAKLSEMDNMDEEETMEEGKMKEKEMKENYDMKESLADMSTEEFLEFCRENPMHPGCPGGMSEEKEKDMNEMDLDELLRELESMDEDADEMKEDLYEAEDELINNRGGAGNLPKSPDMVEEKDEEVKASEDEEIDIENMDENDLKSFIESVIADMVAAGELEGNIEAKGDEDEIEVKDEEEVKMKEVKSGNPYDTEDAIEYGKYLDSLEEAKKAKKEMDEMKKELDEAYSALATIKSELNEVNLFNAKLLYTNKIFKAKNLTESQKVKVLAAFDKAASVKEAKLVFETLSEGFKEKKSSVNESLLMGSASKIAGIAEKKPILEVNDQFARWQTLAGIKK